MHSGYLASCASGLAQSATDCCDECIVGFRRLLGSSHGLLSFNWGVRPGLSYTAQASANGRTSGDFNPEMSHVLPPCGANKLHSQLQALTSIIEKFGGKTAYSEHKDSGICVEASHERGREGQ
jgi:hypothetical protein